MILVDKGSAITEGGIGYKRILVDKGSAITEGGIGY